MKRNAPRDADFVIVGAGSAGCIVAAQLAGAGASVILVEAGGTDRRPDVRLPLGIVSLYATANWRYPTAPDPSKNGIGGAFASGRIVGGSGSINAMVFVRGRPSDFDKWADLGATGWEFTSVLPHFKSIENWVGGPDEYRGAAGPVAVSWCGHHHPLDDAFIEAAVEAGHDRNPDPNGRTQLGVARSQVNQSRGLRCSSAKGFLRGLPGVSRPYLLTKTKATRILVSDGRAIGVECEGQTLRARQEVILCAGAIGSPALLLRSGIGPGLSVVDLPGVGENLQDHLVVTQHWKSKVPTINTIGPLRAVRAAGSLAIKGTGALTTTPFEAQLFTDEFQIAISPVRYELDPVRGRASLRRSDAFTVYTVLMHPETRGRVRLRGGSPELELTRLGRDHDIRRLQDGVEMTRELIETQPAMRGLAGEYLDEDGTTGAAWLAARENSIYHAVGTCRMGSDDNSVVDPQLRVHGVEGLRVIDASVMPTITSGNTNAATMMIAHRGADLLLRIS